MSERKGRHGLENCEVDLAKSCVHGLRTTVLLIETVAGSSDSVEGVHRALDVEDCEAAARALVCIPMVLPRTSKKNPISNAPPYLRTMRDIGSFPMLACV
ncbi:hypothetical protein GYH30_041942 [Glycine max]|nr:hypothetical protein GYH30_041942 [Glycine max]